MPEQRVSCPRHHLAFILTPEGISYKCRAGECRQVYLVTWAELDARRRSLAPCGKVEEKQEIGS